MNAVDRFSRSVFRLIPISARQPSAASFLYHPWDWRASPPSIPKRALSSMADVGVIALPKMPAVTPFSIIDRHRAAYDVDDIRQYASRHAVDRQPVQMIELVEETVNNVVAEVGIAHGVRQGCDQIGKRNHRKVDLLPRFLVFHHAEAIAA